MILLISGPSGAGKSTVLKRLLGREPRLQFSVSTTTRPPRAGEAEGVDYRFVDVATFDRLVAGDAFLEWAEVHGQRYGTRREDVQAAEQAGRIPLLDIDVQGGVQVLDRLGDEVVSVFLLPPSWQELESRLRGRGTDSDEVVATRLRNARWEVGFADRYTYWVVNDEVEQAVARLEAILCAEACRASRQGGPPVS
jgi:guanylate kinase